LLIEARILPALKGPSITQGYKGKPALLAVAINQQSLLNIRQHTVFQIPIERWRLQQIQAESVDRTHEHFGQAEI
jgi:hypothetical protein